ncbi:MAG: PHP domain-containing protein [Patescibacteria group bacterium]|nr:PHP domain-containing protein [Patescibacteria group bacterium]
MTGYIDLHTHTVASDGKLKVSQLIKKAKEASLAALGITDHDSIGSLEEALKEGDRVGLEVVPGCELTSYRGEKEFHILGYYLDFRNEQFCERLKFLQKTREERAKKIVEKLNRLGYQVNFQEVRNLAAGAIVLPHIVGAVLKNSENKTKLLNEFGEVQNIGVFIDRYLVRGAPAYVSKEGFEPDEAIKTIHQLGGLAVLAHPCWDLTKVVQGNTFFDQDFYLEELAKSNLDGVEAIAYRENDEITKVCVDHFSELAERFDLAITGGSDFHGYREIGKDLGLVNVYLKVPYSCLERLKGKKHD